MQGAFLILSVGIEFFLLAGYLFYLLFRTYAESDDKVSMLSWLTGIIGLITVGLIVSVAAVATRMTNTDLAIAVAILAVDAVGLFLLIDDIRRISRKLEVKPPSYS
ncbi:MAG: hypothetical protein KGD60_04985 [Candidatus Thorarchaeota archaeon]|nr:hypothetical protein [Candidatus Thorarchaeota archaeon]